MLAGWLLGPLKEALKLIFNRILAPYVENLDLNQLNYGLSEGQLTLRNLRLKKSALAKFQLPVDVLEGHLGTFSISLHWTNLGNKPAEILIEDLYLLLSPAFHSQPNAKEEERREQTMKTEKLANAELLDDQSQVVKPSDGSAQSQGYVEALVARIINNIQITVRNVHVRYEDKLSVPGHKFAAGVTLAEVSTLSVNEKWEAAFIETTAGAVRKVLNLESLAVYFDTDTELLTGLSAPEVVKQFTKMIPRNSETAEAIDHQFILHPVSGQGRMTMNRRPNADAPALDFELLFDELSLAVNRHQYHDVLSLADAFSIFERRRKYVKYRPSDEDARRRWTFAIDSVMADVHQERQKWTWAYFAERRDDRKKYIGLYSKHLTTPLTGQDLDDMRNLDRKLSYEDLRLYRSVVRTKHRKDAELQRKHESAAQKPTWGQWLGLTAASANEVPELRGPETEEERQELYTFAGLSDTDTVNSSYLPKDTVTMRVSASLKKGSFTLKTHKNKSPEDLISAVFDVFQAKFMRRPDSFVASVSLGDLSIYDRTAKNSVFQQIVQVKQADLKSLIDAPLEPNLPKDDEDPFLYVQFEHNPLDGSADNALMARMRHTEIIYHRGYVEAIHRFFRPPDSQLESLETLLNVASQRLDGLAKETRLGIALETHKTINLQMDLNAPVIIVPEDITTYNSRVLIIDAGHIAIESELAERKTIQNILLKRQQDRSVEESQRLVDESYDKFSLRLEAAQFVLGPDLQSSRDALTSERKDSLHLLERINISLQVERSIAPDEVDLPRIKTAGKLPELHVNFSDTKYKAIMALINVAIPHFDDGRPALETRRSSKGGASRPSLPMLPSSPEAQHGALEPSKTAASSSRVVGSSVLDDNFWKQAIFTLRFDVQSLKVSVTKSQANNVERALGEIVLSQFGLDLSVAKFDMDVRINLRSLNMDLLHPTRPPVQFMRSQGDPETQQSDLLTVVYHRSQQDSPEFAGIHEGIEQSVDVSLSTFIFQAAPEPVIDVYDFIMTTFVPQNGPSVDLTPTIIEEDVFEDASDELLEAQISGKIRARVKLASVQVIVLNDDSRLATLSLSTANVSVTLDNGALSLFGRLGSLNLTHDSAAHTIRDEFHQIISIEGENFADFKYETCDPNSSETPGFASAVFLEAASIKVHFLEGPLHDLYVYLFKLARLKGLYDTARTAAVQRASEMNLVHFKVSVRSPLVVLPFDAAGSADRLVLRLGAIEAGNVCTGSEIETNASLHGIGLVSIVKLGDTQNSLDIIGDINVDTHILQTRGIDRTQDLERPDTQISVNISNVDLALTHNQYIALIQLSQSIPRIFQIPPDVTEVSAETPDHSSTPAEATVGLAPELSTLDAGQKSWVSLDLVVTINVVKLHLYDHETNSKEDLDHHGIMRFALSENSLRLKILSDGALEAQVILKSFIMGNKRPGLSKFRQITASRSDRNQFMVLYTQANNPEVPGQLVVTVDAPQVIFTVDPIIALVYFLTLPSTTPANITETSTRTTHTQSQSKPQAASSTGRGLDVRMDLHDVSISVLEDDSDAESQAIRLSIKEVLLTKQTVITMNVDHLKMSLLKMGKASDEVNILDDVDMSCSLDNRSSASHQTMDIELTSKPIVFRASHRDIMLILSIVNKAIALSNRSATQQSSPTPSESEVPLSPLTTSAFSEAQAFITSEKLKASFDGVSFVLIGDLNEQPMLHLKLKPFIVGAKDWSSQLQATTTIATQLRYFNLANSHWEPLIDPWTFTVTCGKSGTQGPMQIGLYARERLDLNLTSTFAEFAINTANSWSKIADQALTGTRGSYAPYHIRNRTGLRISIWPDNDGNADLQSGGIIIGSNEGTDWRFDDWKTMREHVATQSQHNISLQFIDKSWDNVRGIPVDRAGEYTFVLKSRVDRRSHRLLCEVRVVDHTKIVTIRSTVQIHNNTLYSLEIMSVDNEHRPVSSLEKINAGDEYALPVEMVGVTNLRVQPDQGFGYKWSQAISLSEIPPKRGFSIKCVHSDPREAAFRFQGWIDSDLVSRSSGLSPKLDLRLRAPIELENLLPFNIQYRIYDKNTDQNWRSYLRQGGIMPVHSVDLGHLVLLNVEIEDTVFKPSEFAIINTDSHADFDVESKLLIADDENRKLSLRINYIRYPDSGGAFKAQIYSPFIVINKTGLPFKIKPRRPNRSSPECAGDSRPDMLATPVPFMLSHIQEKRHEFVFQIGQSDWSEPLSVEAPSAESSLVVPIQNQKGHELHVGVSWTEGLGKYKLSKVITLAPRFLIKNTLPEPISFREHGVAPDFRSLIPPGERVPFLTLRSSEQRLATIAFPGLNTEWSAPFNLEDIGSVHIRVKRPGNSQEELIKCEIRLDGSSIFIFLSPASGGWPFRIENDTDYEFSLSQSWSVNEDGSAKQTQSNKSYGIKPRANLPYAWDYPASPVKQLIMSINGSNRTIDMKEIGVLVPFTFTDTNRRRGVISLDVRAEEHRQVLRISQYNQDKSVYKPQARVPPTPTRQDTTSSLNADTFEAVTDEIPPTFTFGLDLAGIGVSLINKKLLEVIYASLTGLKIDYSTSSVAQSVHISCASIQVDNQLHEALYPVILQPTPVSRESTGLAALPTIQASVIWLNDQGHGVLFIKYLSILLQALTIEADEDLLFALYDLTQIQGISWEDGVEDKLLVHPTTIPEPSGAQQGQDLYFEVLELQPVKLLLSFMRTERITSDQKLSIRNPIAVVVNALTMAVGNINDAALELNALAIKDMRLTSPELQSRILYHYRQDVIRQLYRLLGSADFIGNPVGLFTNVSSGVADIFYEPFHGVVMHGNKELGIGIAKGAASFVKKTVFGVTDSMTKFTSSVGKGLSAATFDPEYQARRRLAQRRNRPRHALYGVAAGGEAFASSISSAVEGVLFKPMEGADREGAVGFFKGIGKGFMGAVTKPVVGVFDLASNVTEGIRNTTVVFDKAARDRVRLPRHVPSDGVLTSYSAREAQGQYWMRDLDSGAFRQEAYVAHINSPGGDNVVLLTMSRVLSFWTKNLRLEWELPFTQVSGVTVEDTGIRFTHKAGRDGNKFVNIPDKSGQTWFFEQVAGVVKSYNQRKKIEKA